MTLKKVNTIVVSIFLSIAVFALAGVTVVAIAKVSLSLRLVEYSLGILWAATLVQVAIFAIGFVSCIGLVREIKRLWQSA